MVISSYQKATKFFYENLFWQFPSIGIQAPQENGALFSPKITPKNRTGCLSGLPGSYPLEVWGWIMPTSQIPKQNSDEAQQTFPLYCKLQVISFLFSLRKDSYFKSRLEIWPWILIYCFVYEHLSGFSPWQHRWALCHHRSFLIRPLSSTTVYESANHWKLTLLWFLKLLLPTPINFEQFILSWTEEI